MKRSYLSLCLLLFISGSALAKEINNEQPKQQHQTQAIEAFCAEKLEQNYTEKQLENCIKEQQDIERIIVNGTYVGIEAPEVIGRFYIDKAFIDAAPKTTGDINDLVALLPGVQTSESADGIENLAEISAKQISISGAQPWQTGFYLDGLNYNSIVDPGSSDRTSASKYDVVGGAQTMNVNSQIISSITVFDNNIPAEFGEFSGGVIDSETINPFDDGEIPFSLSYRGNNSDWGSYHTIDNRLLGYDKPFDDTEPEFTKNNYDLLIAKKINKNHGITLSASYLNSIISDTSLGEIKKEKRTNINALIKYSYRNGWIDRLDASLLYAPYQSDEYIKDVLNSDFTLDGGSAGATLNLTHEFDWSSWESKLSYSKSDNSRQAPDHYYSWVTANGKNWGLQESGNLDNTETSDGDSIQTSKEGGYGDLDNTQTHISWKNKFTLPEFALFETFHNVTFGTEISLRQVERTRKQDQYDYNGPVLYSTSLDSNSLNCSGYAFDCVEIQYAKPLDQLRAELGGGIDFGNPDHVIAYSNNVLVSPQYFQTRLLSPKEHIEADINKYAMYISDRFTVGNAEINLGLRYDIDDFFKNHNFAPRFSLGYDVIGDGNSMAILGLNRYYDAGLISYEIRSQQQYSYLQYRPIVDGYLQGWVDYSSTGNYKYRFNKIKTPYDDEFVIGWKQSTDWFGNFSIKHVRRWKSDQLARIQDPIEEDGYRYIEMTNNGQGRSERTTFAWDAQFYGHSVWFNTSYTQNTSNNENYSKSVDNTPLDELVYYETHPAQGDQSATIELISKSDLTLLNSNFSRPMTFKFGWSYDWFESFNTTITGAYKESYTTAVQQSTEKSTGDLSRDCSSCPAVSVLLPYYKKEKKHSVLQLALSMRWNIAISKKQQLQLRTDISNLLNDRTYTVSQTGAGLEPGRQYWIGVKYQYD